MIVKIEGNDVFLAEGVYDRLLEALAAVKPIPAIDGVKRSIEPWQFVEALGEAGIWNADILNDPRRSPAA
jgi:hypothetical protein